MKELKNKILYAINKGLNEALNLDDFSEDDLKIQKKSLGTIISNSNKSSLLYNYDEKIVNLYKQFSYENRELLIYANDMYKTFKKQFKPSEELLGCEFR